MRAEKVSFDEKAIDEIFRCLDSSLPGAAAGIAIGGVPVYRRGFGLARMEAPVALNPQTRMRIHSITKHFTCLAYLLLREEGVAAIDDPIGKYLPELHPITHGVTMSQLMSHTSGLRDACDIRWFFSGIQRIVPARDLIALYQEIDSVNFRAGQAWCYNNGAYHVLSAVIEKLEDRPLEEVFRRRIFEPAGMHDTLLRRLDDDYLANSVAMHMLTPRKTYESTHLPGELVGEGGIVSTVGDMLQWMRNMSRPVVGSADTWALMTTSQRLDGGAETGYGLGLLVGSYRGWNVLSHAGGGVGSNCQMIRVPGADLDVIVMVNRSDLNSLELAARILDSCLGMEPQSAGADYRYIEGLFRSRTTGRAIHLFGREGRQVMAIDGGEEMPGRFTADHEIGPPAHSCWPFAIKWRGSQPASIQYDSHGSIDELTTVSNEMPLGLDMIAGDYLAHGIGAGLTVATEEEKGCHLITRGNFGSRVYRAERIAGSTWRVKSSDGTGWCGTLTADRASEALMLQTPETWRVSFRRSG